MKQMSLEAPMYTGFELRAKRTRKRAFLEQMDRVVLRHFVWNPTVTMTPGR